MEYKCEYCGAEFNLSWNLSKHQRTAKYCLKIRGLEPTLCKFECKFCNTDFGRKDVLKRHLKTCKQRPVENLQESPTTSPEPAAKTAEGDIYKDVLEMVLEKLMNSQGNTSVNGSSSADGRNVVMQGLEPITETELRKHLDKLSLSFIQDGARGYANYAGEYPLKNKVICTDRSRKKLRYKNETGELTDNGKALAQRFFMAISVRNKEILGEAYSKLQEELKDIVTQEKAGDCDVTGILTKATHLQDILIRSQNAAEGKDDQFSQDFLGHLSKVL